MSSSALRSLPRVFVEGATSTGTIDLPPAELDKLRKVLRLSTGAEIAVLPNDGSLIRCVLEGRHAVPLDQTWPATESSRRLTIAQALPKGDKLEEIVRACTEIGVARFIMFSSDRTVVRWDAEKIKSRIQRLKTIAMEACEMSFRTKLPTFLVARDLEHVFEICPDAYALSESETTTQKLKGSGEEICLAVGPEGGWSPEELITIGRSGLTLGPRILRVDHAAAAAASILLLAHA